MIIVVIFLVGAVPLVVIGSPVSPSSMGVDLLEDVSLAEKQELNP